MILHQRKKEAGAGPRYRKRLCVSCFWLFCFLITSTTSTTANEVASLNLCVPVDGNLCRTRRFLSTSDEGAGAVEEHPLQQQPTAPNYFDNLRIALYNTSNTEAWNVSSEIKSDANSTIFLVSLFQEETNNSTATAIGIGIARQFRLVHISAFLPFSRDGAVLPINRNEGFTSLLALYHLNNMQDYGHPVLGDQILTLYPSLASCNVRFTMNLFDTQFSPSFTTQTMTAVSRRPVSIQSPPTSAVMGSHYSSETLPLATFTSAKDIPQVSASATSVTLDEKGQFPMFGRTVGSTDGEAAVAVQFFKEMGSTNVAVIFGTDPYVSTLQKAFVVQAYDAGIKTESIVFSDTASEADLRSIMVWLRHLEYHHVFVICFEDRVEAVMTAAVSEGVVGRDFFYVFPCFDVFTLQENLMFKHGSPLSKAFHGSGLIQMQGTVNSERFIIGKEKKASSVDPDSIIGSDRFRVSWRDALQDMAFVDFVQEKLPSSLDDKSGFNRSTEFTDDPHGFLNFNYDAITSLGLSMCMAGDNTTFFNGYDIYQQFLQLDFEGASGQIRILSESGSRDYKTIAFVVWNVRILGENAEGYSIIEYVPSYHYQNGRWTEILGNGFEFADGTKDIPESLPPLAFNYNYIGKPSRIVSYILMGMVMTAALASAVWTLYHKHSHVVDSAQPLFLIAISLGSFFMAVTILPLGFEETVVSNIQGLDAACMAVPWLYFLGASIAISGLLAKTKAVHQAYVNPDLEEIQITSVDILRFATVLVPMNLFILVTWTLVSPLEWTRVMNDKKDIFERNQESAAVCRSDHYIWFASVLCAVNLGFLFVGTCWAFRTRNLATEYNESRYIGITVVALLQTWSMGIPVLIVVRDYPVADFFVKSGLILLSAGAVLCLVYLPKVLSMRQHSSASTEHNSFFSGGFQFVLKRKRNSASDTEQSNNDIANQTEERPGQGSQVVPSPSQETGSLRPERRQSVKILHNPRSERNLSISGGQEMSMGQLSLYQNSTISNSHIKDLCVKDVKLDGDIIENEPLEKETERKSSKMKEHDSDADHLDD